MRCWEATTETGIRFGAAVPLRGRQRQVCQRRTPIEKVSKDARRTVTREREKLNTHIPSYAVRARSRPDFLSDELESRFQDFVRDTDQRFIPSLGAFDKNTIEQKIVIEEFEVHRDQYAAVENGAFYARTPMKKAREFIPCPARVLRYFTKHISSIISD